MFLYQTIEFSVSIHKHDYKPVLCFNACSQTLHAETKAVTVFDVKVDIVSIISSHVQKQGKTTDKPA